MHDPKTCLTLVRVDNGLGLLLAHGLDTLGEENGVDLGEKAASRAAAVGPGAEVVAAGGEVAETLADLVRRAVVVGGIATGVSAACAGCVDVASALAGLDGGEEGGEASEDDVELHVGWWVGFFRLKEVVLGEEKLEEGLMSELMMVRVRVSLDLSVFRRSLYTFLSQHRQEE